MYQPVSFEQLGTPLSVFNPSQFQSWLTTQPPSIQAWLNNTGYNGIGLALIPDANGQLIQAVYGYSGTSQLFSSADLFKSLPAKTFLLEANHPDALDIAIAWGLASYKFDLYKKNTQTAATLAINDQAVVTQANQFIAATCLVRDLINSPAGDMMPQHMAKAAEQLATEFGGQFEQIVGDDLLTQNYPTIHAVGRASCHAPRLLDIRWGNPTHPKVTLVGKGVCFDSGGLDLKPSQAMRNMKKDMGGAAHVLGLAHLIMSHNLPVQLRVLIPSVENAVSNNAFRPGDVITTRQGITVEIDNTDAEGRLVLCDALTEACSDDPEVIIDFATLTGACRVALGTELPGFFSTDKQLARDLMEIGEQNSDPVWQLPLHAAYTDMLKSDVADMVNSVPSPFGGAITAALYLQAFVKADIPWMHFDVMAWNNRSLPGRPVGGEAMGIRSVFTLLQQKYTA